MELSGSQGNLRGAKHMPHSFTSTALFKKDLHTTTAADSYGALAVAWIRLAATRLAFRYS